jgi:hypothetical protein
MERDSASVFFARDFLLRRSFAPRPSTAAQNGMEDLDAGAVEMRMLGEVAAEGAHTRLPVEQPKDVARHLIQPPALGEARTPTEQATKDRCYWPKMLIPFFHVSVA